MLIEQIIELKEPGPPVKHILQNPIIFMARQKSPKKMLKRLFTAKNIAGGNVPCFSQLGQVTYVI